MIICGTDGKLKTVRIMLQPTDDTLILPFDKLPELRKILSGWEKNFELGRTPGEVAASLLSKGNLGETES